MHAITNPAMNAAQQGMAGQGSVYVGLAAQDTQSAYNQAAQRRVESWIDHVRQTNVQIVQADNGYILTFRPTEFGSAPRTLVATTIEEVRDLITSEMVSRKLEK